jgi:hypothetical protein
MIRPALLATAVLSSAVIGAADLDLRLGEPIRGWDHEPSPIGAPESTSRAVDTWNRSAVASFFHTMYTPAMSVPMQWSGNASSCNAGSTSQAYIDATMQMINFYRGMAGLPDATNDVSRNQGCQDAALIMSVNNALSHSPPSSWSCWTAAGAAAAGGSNLALGAAGPDAIDLYARDPGSFNAPVGHRRWILCPVKGSFGTGSVGETTRDANALYVFTSNVSRPATPDVVAWPPEGFVPYQVVYPRWSLSLNSSPGAGYGSATVTMTEDGSPISLSVVSRSDNGYCDNTIVWEPSGLTFTPGGEDRRITVTVSGISGTPSSVTYDVVIMDPDVVTELIFSDGFESGDIGAWL